MDEPLVVGVVKSHITASKSLWMCKKKMACEGDNGEKISYDKRYSFFAINCTKVGQQNGTGACIEYAESKRSLIQRLHNEVKLREGRLDQNLNDTLLMVSPGLMRNKI